MSLTHGSFEAVRALLEAADHERGDDRVITLAIASDVVLTLKKATEAFQCVNYFLKVMHGPELGGRGVALLTVADLVRKFRDHPLFRDLAANFHNEVSLVALAAQDRHVKKLAFRYLEQFPQSDGTT